MEKQKIAKKWAKWLWIFVGLLFVMIIFSGNYEEKNSDNDNENLTLEQSIKKTIEEIAGLKTNLSDYPDRIERIIVNETEEQPFISVTLVANENISKNTIRNGIFKNTIEIMEKVASNYENIREFRFFWKYPLVDINGNENFQNVVKLYFENDVIYKTNWKNILYDDLPKIANMAEIHNSLK